MKVSTRQYAKKQVRWIRGKLLPELSLVPSDEAAIYLFDASGESSHWVSAA